MNTKNIFKTVALAMLMPAVLLTASCSKGDDAVTNPEKPANTEAAETAVNKGYALPVTVNVTRQGDADTRATYTDNGDGTGSLGFSAGDKLFVSGSATAAGSFAGALDYVPATGNFSGTIYTEKEWTGTADALFIAASAGDNLTATLLPAGYESYYYLYIYTNNNEAAYDDYVGQFYYYSFLTSKTTGIEQLSCERTYTYSDGFALAPQNAILNFTVTGLPANTDVYAKFDCGVIEVSKDITTDGSGNATFVAGIPEGYNLKIFTLTVDGLPITLTDGDKTLEAGKIYNITRSTGGTVNLSTINADYTASNGEILTGTLASDVKISIADGATVMLKNVTINGTNSDSYMWAGISCEGDATIILSGTNSVTGFHIHYPGIHIAEGKTLTIDGTGSLNASSNGMGAGIGGGQGIACGNIVINSGNITATGGQNSAGIGGGGNEASCGAITISGGTITATGGGDGAGIGSGYWGTCVAITISGGTITATGGDSGAGIGGSYRGTCGNITISGGTVDATGSGSSYGGAGIGSGRTGSCGNIKITSGVTQVTATKGLNANSIGVGGGGSCGTVTIGGVVYPDGIAESPYTYQP